MTPARPNRRSRHGTVARARSGCECTKCNRAANAADYAAEYRKSGARGRPVARRETPLRPDDVTPQGRRFGNRTHGVISSYVAGCGCTDCRAAATSARQNYARH